LEELLTNNLEGLAHLRYGQDYDRILYSSSFRKLGDVTQVVSGETALFHTRLTHSLKTAQTAGLVIADLRRWINTSRDNHGTVRRYGGIDPRVVRSACLAHDLGNPPFGSIGKAAIKNVLVEPSRHIAGFQEEYDGLVGGFDTSAQAFRIVTRLAFRSKPTGDVGPALNLTRATLAAMCKYPWSGEADEVSLTRDKWGVYDSEADLLNWVLDGSMPRSAIRYGRDIQEARTLEAQVMDWADDIAYAVHDLEDFFRAGLVPLNELSNMGIEFKQFIKYALERVADKLPPGITENRVADIFDEKLATWIPRRPYIGSEIDRIALHGFAAEMIKLATRDLNVTPEGVLLCDEDVYVLIEILKQLTRYYVIDRPSLSSAQRGQQIILTSLISELWSWAYEFHRDPAVAGDSPAEDDEYEEAPGSGEQSRARQRRYVNLPPRLVDYIDIACDPAIGGSPPSFAASVLRGVIDYAVSLTDSQAIFLHNRLSGGTRQSMLESWLFI
jgi:dGTPase